MSNAVSYFFSYFVEALILWLYSSSLFITKRKSKRIISLLSLLYMILFVVSLIESKWLNLFLYFAVNCTFLITQFRIKWPIVLFHAFILEAVMGMCELMVYGIIKYFAPHFLEGQRDFIHMLLFAVFSKLVFFTIVYILIHLLYGQKEADAQNNNISFLLVFIPISSVFVMITFISFGENVPLSPIQSGLIMAGSILMLFSNLLVFGVNHYNQRKNKEFMEMQLLLQKESATAEYYEMLRLQNESQRILIHDIKGHLQSISLLNEQNEPKKINAYIRQLILSSDLKESARLCDHELLNSILHRYVQECGRKHIAFHADVRSGTVDFITDNDLTSLFCNLLDNALEAAAVAPDADNAYIELNISKREHTPFVVISLINFCRTNPFCGQSGNLITRKMDKRRHGFGLKSIRRTIHKYDGDIQMYYNNDTMTFHTIITLKSNG